MRDGLAEMLKYGVICDAALFDRIKNYKHEDIAALIARCVEIKRDVVAEDEFDRGRRALLNLGHTVGHAIEEAGGIAAPGTAARIDAALAALGLPCGTEFDIATLAPLMQGDKKADGTAISLILPRAVGDCIVRRMDMDAAAALIAKGL